MQHGTLLLVAICMSSSKSTWTVLDPSKKTHDHVAIGCKHIQYRLQSHYQSTIIVAFATIINIFWSVLLSGKVLYVILKIECKIASSLSDRETHHFFFVFFSGKLALNNFFGRCILKWVKTNIAKTGVNWA